MTSKLASFGRYGMHTIQYPSGRWGYVGKLPSIFCEEKTQKNGLKYTASLAFNTEAEAIRYFEENKHLLSDCHLVDNANPVSNGY